MWTGSVLSLSIATLALGLVVGGGQPQSITPALDSAGPLTAWGLPIARLVFDIAAIGTVGTILLAVVLLPAPPGALTETAMGCLRAAAWWAALWSAAAVVTSMFLLSDILGKPVNQALPGPALVSLMWSIPQERALGITAAVAIVIATALHRIRTRIPAAILLLGGIANLLPVAFTGHAASSTTPGAAAFIVSLHVVAIALWVGGLLGIIIHLRSSSTLLASVVPRFSPLALGCFVAAGLTGLTSAWIHLGSVTAVWQSRYGLLVLAKSGSLIILGCCGWWHRHHTIYALIHRLQRHPFARWAAAEITIMATTLALAVSLSRSPPP